MPKYSRRRAVLAVLAIVGGVAFGRLLLREPPSEGEVTLTAELFWMPSPPADIAHGWDFVKGGKTLAVRVRNESAATAKVFDFSGRACSGLIRSLPDGFTLDVELYDDSGRRIPEQLGRSIKCESQFDAADVAANASPVYKFGSRQVAVPARLGRHFAGKPPVFDFAAGQSIDMPFAPFPYLGPDKLAPSTYTIAVVVTWLDATTQEKKQFRSPPLSFDFTLEDRERHSAQIEAAVAAIFAKPFNQSRW